MGTPGVRWSEDVSQAAWIGPRLDAFGRHVVGSVIPNGFPAYARLPHPAVRVDDNGEWVVRWREVAEWSGLAPDRRAQFADVAMPERLPRAPVPWTDPPAQGTLSRHDAAALIELLAPHTGSQQCWFCVWEGYGWHRESTHAFSSYLSESPEPPQDFPDSRVRLPARDYLLYTGPLPDALAFLDGREQTPNLFWPQDRSWCVATEIDVYSTFLAGSGALIEDAFADPALEALPAETRDSVLQHAPEWVTRAVRPAVTDLLEHGRTTLTVDYGTVRAELRSRRWRKRAWLQTSSEGFGESFGTGPGIVPDPPEQRRRAIEAALTDAVLGFVTG